MRTYPILILIVFISFIPNIKAQDARVLRYLRHCEINTTKQLTETDSILIQVNNRNGQEYTAISIPYSKIVRITNLKGWIEDKNGTKIRLLTKADITDASLTDDNTMYQDNMAKSVNLKYFGFPYRVFYTYTTVRQEFLSIADWSPVFRYEIPTDSAALIITTPPGYSLKYTDKQVSSFSKALQNSPITYRWSASYIKPLLAEKLNTNLEILTPYVKVRPDYLNYGISGDFTSWKSFGEWFRGLTKGLNDPSEADKNEVKNLIAGITDTREKIRRIYHFMQDHTRYINVILGIGGYKPFPASYVSANKYGDCKALSNYMKALLEVAGINSYYTILEGAISPNSIIENFPSQQFNHVILTVPVGKDTLYMENTSNISPFGYAGPFISNRKALLIADGNSHLITIPAPGKEQYTDHRNISIRLEECEYTEADVSIKYRGYDFERLNSLSGNYNTDMQNKNIREFIPLGNYTLDDWKLDKPDRDSTFITLKSKVTLQNYLRKADNDYYFSIFNIGKLGFDAPAYRTLPVSIHFPIIYCDTVSYQLPRNSKIKFIAKDNMIKSQYGTCMFHLSQTGNKILMYRTFTLYSGEIEVKEYPEFYAFLQNVEEAESHCLVIYTRQV